MAPADQTGCRTQRAFARTPVSLMDQATAILLAGLLTAIAATIVGLINVGGSLFAGRLEEGRRRKDRLRDFRREQIRETREYCVVFTNLMKDAASGELRFFSGMWIGWQAKRKMAKLTLADLSLLGELRAYDAWANAIIRLAHPWPSRPWMAPIVLFFWNPWKREDVEEIDRAIAAMLGALRRQEERVLSGQELLVLDAETARKLDLTALQRATDKMAGKRSSSGSSDTGDTPGGTRKS